MGDRVQEISSWYESDNPGTKTNIARLLNRRQIGGARQIGDSPGRSGVRAWTGQQFCSESLPDIIRITIFSWRSTPVATPTPLHWDSSKLEPASLPGGFRSSSSSTTMMSLHDEKDPMPSVTGSVREALRLGMFRRWIYHLPGIVPLQPMYEQLRAIAEEAKSCGLAVVVWSYPRGSGLSKEGETAMDVVAYAAQIAAQLGAHVIKVKLPTAHLEQAAAKKVYEAEKVPIKHVGGTGETCRAKFVRRARIVIFSGGAKSDEKTVFEEARAIRDGGGFGSIIGRNSFQRPKSDAIKFLQTIMGLYAGGQP